MATSLLDRFVEKINEPDDPHNDCWTWSGSKTGRGYGKIWANGRLDGAHRVSHELFIGLIPEGHVVDHMCRNRSCVRPDHLQAITRFESDGQKNRGKTHCVNGHEFNEGNTYRWGNRRRCKTCDSERNRMSYMSKGGR